MKALNHSRIFKPGRPTRSTKVSIGSEPSIYLITLLSGLVQRKNCERKIQNARKFIVQFLKLVSGKLYEMCIKIIPTHWDMPSFNRLMYFLIYAPGRPLFSIVCLLILRPSHQDAGI